MTGSGECWKDSAVDWLVHGVLATCARRGYPQLQVCRVLNFTVGPPRTALFLSAATETCQVPVREVPVKVTKWRESLSWDLDRSKEPLKDAAKFKQLAAPLDALLSAKGVTHAVLHEPGFHHVLPRLQQSLACVSCCAGHDQVQENELRRCAANVVGLGGLCGLADADAMILLAEGGPAAWRDLWFDATSSWLELIDAPESKSFVLAVMVEASSIKGVDKLTSDLEDVMASFSHNFHRELQTTIDNLSRRSQVIVWEICCSKP